jgi:multicomponent K+:H+ antiporter subunit F
MMTLLAFSMNFILVCVILAMAFCTVRLLLGPAAQDRVLALDTLWMCGMLLALVLGIRFGSQIYFEIALLIALTGFVSTIALTLFLLRGEVVE